MHERAAAGQQKPANGQLCLNYLSHPRGASPLSTQRSYFAPPSLLFFETLLSKRSLLDMPFFETLFQNRSFKMFIPNALS